MPSVWKAKWRGRSSHAAMRRQQLLWSVKSGSRDQCYPLLTGFYGYTTPTRQDVLQKAPIIEVWEAAILFYQIPKLHRSRVLSSGSLPGALQFGPFSSHLQQTTPFLFAVYDLNMRHIRSFSFQSLRKDPGIPGIKKRDCDGLETLLDPC